MLKHSKELIARLVISAAAICAAVMLPQDAAAQTHLPLSYYTTQSALSSGHWARIKVSKEGMHQITYDQLRQLGFSDPSKVKVCGFGGASLYHDRFLTSDPDDVVATKFLHTDDGRIIFYAQPDVINAINSYYSHKVSSSSTLSSRQYNIETHRNYYAAYGCYLLTDADVASTAVDEPYTPASDLVQDSHLSLSYVENEVNQPKCELSGGTVSIMNSSVLHGGDITGQSSAEVSFGVTDYDETSTLPAQMAVSVAVGWPGYVNYQDYAVDGMTGFDIEKATTDDGTSLGLSIGLSQSPSATAYTTYNGYYNLRPTDAAGVPDGTFTANIALPGTSSPTPYYQAFDKGWLIYPRKNNFRSEPGGMLMFVNDVEYNTGVRLSGASATTQVWDVTNNYRVRTLGGSYDAATQQLSVTPGATYCLDYGTGCGRLIVFDPADQQLPVELMGVVPNQNLHGCDDAAMLIITTEDLYDKAVELAKIHEAYDGSHVVVATQQQIFNEFSSGTPDAIAYRRMAKMLYDRNTSMFKGILLYGTSVSDNRQITRQFSAEKLLVYEALPTGTVMTNASIYPELHIGSDHYFGMLDGAYYPSLMYSSLLSVPVGRLPIADAATADGVNKKIERYLNNASTNFKNYPRVLLSADDGDYNGHFRDSKNLMDAMTECNDALTFISSQISLFDRPNGLAPNAAKLLNDALKSGIGFFDYCGHGRPDSFTDNGLLDVSTVNTFDNNVYPFAMISSCNTNMYDQDGSPSITQAMVLNPNGGMIAAVGATRSVYQSSNQILNEAMGRAYATPGSNSTVGNVYQTAINAVIGKTVNATIYDRDRFNTHCYGLVGDPLIPLSKHQYTARVVSINGTDIVNATDPVEVEPLTKVTISGDIVLPGNYVYTSFNGSVDLRIYDGNEVIETKRNGSYSESVEYIEKFEQQYRMLTSTVAKVTNGKWTAEVVMPYSTYLSYMGKDDAGNDVEKSSVNRIVATAEGVADNGSKVYALGSTDRLRILPGSGEAITASAPVIEEFYLDTPDFRDGALVGSSATVHAKVRLSESGLSTSENTGESGRLVLDGGARNFAGAMAGMILDGSDYATLSYPITDLSAGRHTLTLSVRDNLGQLATANLSFISGKFDQRPRLVTEEEVARTEAVINFYGDLVEASADDSEVSLYITDRKGDTVLKVDNPSFPYTWDLNNGKGDKVADGNYKAVVRGRLGTQYTYTDPLDIVVIR